MLDKKIIVASGPVIIEEGQVYLNKHGSDPFWKFPGGKVKKCDFDNWENSLEEACLRETLEENGMSIEIIRPLKPMLLPKPGEDNVLVVLIHYLAKRKSEIYLPNNIQQIGRFYIDKIIKNEYLDEAFAPNIIPVLKECLKIK